MSVANRVFQSLLKGNRSSKLAVSFLPGSFNQKCLLHSSHRLAANVPFNLSDIGEGIREVVVKEWYVKVGDKVAQFDNICEVQSDKASVTITSRYDGVISKLHYQVDGIAHVGKPLVDIETDEVEEAPSAESPPKDEPKPVEHFTETTSQEIEDNVQNEILCIPSVRRIAKENKINLAEVTATGKGGRILKEDVLRYLEGKQSGDLPIVFSKADKTVPVTAFQKAMVKTMSDALKIPHFVYSDEISVRNLTLVRDSIKSELSKADIKLSFLPFFIKAASNALSQYPVLNATLDSKCENVTYKSAHNIAVAMDTKIGLAVPVIKNVQTLTIVQIAKELNRLMASGKKGVFAPADLTGGTFAISNIGAIGGTYMKPVILPPQVAIIAIGAMQRLPRFDSEDNVIADQIVNLSGAADHRIVDGASMANFSNLLKKQIENPNLLFLNL